MFYTSFASLIALLGLYAQSSSIYRDFNNLVNIEKDDLSEEGVQEGDSQYSYKNNNSCTFTNIEVLPHFSQGHLSYYEIQRYYISPSPQDGTWLAYIDFYCNYVELEHNGYYMPAYEVYASEQFNLQVDFIFSITNSDFPSTPVQYTDSIDFSNGKYTNYTFQESSFRSYLDIVNSSKLSASLIITCSPINEDRYNSVSNAEESGYQNGYHDGYEDGKDVGISIGHSDNNVMDPQMFTIFNGILNVAMVPVNVFLGIFNWEVFGINIASVVASLLSIAILVIVIRLIAGASAKGN